MGMRVGVTVVLVGVALSVLTACGGASKDSGDIASNGASGQDQSRCKQARDYVTQQDDLIHAGDSTRPSNGILNGQPSYMYSTEDFRIIANLMHATVDNPTCFTPADVAQAQTWLDGYHPS